MSDVERIVLGSGSFGCAVWPALLFDTSHTVNASNVAKFVTKLASDASEEYDLAKVIEQRLLASGSPLALETGVFPVDSLVCGISIKDLGLSASDTSIIKTCGSKAGTILRSNLEASLKERGPIKLSEYVNRRISAGSRKLKGGVVLCGIQYPRYLGNVIGTIQVPPGASSNYQFDIYSRTADKLQLMHHCGVFHLDIKGSNLCYFSDTDVRFADWGLSFVTTKNLLATISVAFDRLDASVLGYYSDLCYVTGRLDTYLQSSAIGLFDSIKEVLYEIGMYYLSRHINAELPIIINELVGEGIDLTIAEYVAKRLSNKIERYMHAVGADVAELIYDYSKRHDIDETLHYAEFNYTFDENTEEFILFLFAERMFDRSQWLNKITGLYARIMNAYNTIDFCLLGATFIKITDSYARSKIEADVIRRIH